MGLPTQQPLRFTLRLTTAAKGCLRQVLARKQMLLIELPTLVEKTRYWLQLVPTWIIGPDMLKAIHVLSLGSIISMLSLMVKATWSQTRSPLGLSLMPSEPLLRRVKLLKTQHVLKLQEPTGKQFQTSQILLNPLPLSHSLTKFLTTAIHRQSMILLASHHLTLFLMLTMAEKM